MGRVFVLGDQTKLCAEPDPSRCVQSRWSSVRTSYVDAPVSVIPNWPIQMQLFITHFASVENLLACFIPVWKQGADSESLRCFEETLLRVIYPCHSFRSDTGSFWRALCPPLGRCGLFLKEVAVVSESWHMVGRCGQWDSGYGDKLVRVLNEMSDCQLGYCLGSNVHGKSSVGWFGLGG